MALTLATGAADQSPRPAEFMDEVKQYTWAPSAGMVKDAASGSPLKGLPVSTFPLAGMNGATDTDGRYTLRGLPGGTYRVRAIDSCRSVSLDAGDWAASTDLRFEAASDRGLCSRRAPTPGAGANRHPAWRPDSTGW